MDIENTRNILQEKLMDIEYYFAENDEYPTTIEVDSDFINALEDAVSILKEMKS